MAATFQRFSPIDIAVGPSATSYALDAVDKRLAFVFQAQSAVPITHLGFRGVSRAGTPGQHTIELRGVDGNGNPDTGGALLGSATFTPGGSGFDNTFFWVPLSASYTPARGQFLSAVVANTSWTTGNTATWTQAWGGAINPRLPYALAYSGTAWSKLSQQPAFAYRTASGRIGVPMSSTWTTLISTNGSRQAGRIVLNGPVGGTFQVAGLRFQGRLLTAGSTTTIGIWSDAGNAIQTCALDTDYSTGTTHGLFEVYFPDADLATLSFNTAYRYGIQSAGTAMYLGGVNLSDAADRLAFPLQTNALYCEWNGTAWTDTDTRLPQIELIVTDISYPSSGGGGPLIGASALVSVGV
jgi:hypothetical protein